MTKVSTVISVASFIFLPAMGMADVLSQQSQSYNQGKTDIDVGKTQYEGGGDVKEGDPGLGYRFVTEGITISLSELKEKATKAANGVYIIDKAGDYHGSIGRFNFTQVADAEIYYGDWSQTGDIADSKHTAFYSGKEIGNDIPIDGQASYTISGVNQYESSSKMPGTFLVDFGQKTYEGTLDGQLANIKFSGEIGEDGKFSGVALANNQAEGISAGQLFGQDAAQVVGITSFAGNHQYDTAFGGVKN